MTSWSVFYENVCGSRRLLEGNIMTNAPVMMEVGRLVKVGDAVLEVGTGTGVLGWPLAQAGVRVVSLDTDTEILRMAQINSALLGAEIEYVEGDGFAMPFPDGSFTVAFSEGLVEHYSNDEIGRLLSEQLRVALLVVVAMPLVGCQGITVGNERWLDMEAWSHLLRGFNVVRAFTYQDGQRGCFTIARSRG